MIHQPPLPNPLPHGGEGAKHESALRQTAIALRDASQQRASSDAIWPAETWRELCAAGVPGWSISADYGGSQLAPSSLLENCLELARGELLVTFVYSQFQAACQRIAVSNSPTIRQRWLPGLAAGKLFGTVGISHLTTSRQHTAPAVTAAPDGDGYRLTGQIPWVTGCRHADMLVIGGALSDGRQILAAVPADRTGITINEPLQLLALTGSETGTVTLQDVEVHSDELIAGPVNGVIQHAGSGGAGSLMTSTLAAGHALHCLDRLQAEAADRPMLESIVVALRNEAEVLRVDLFFAANQPEIHPQTSEQLRARATDLALRSSQALLTASKGAGFAAGHPAERLAREALFFLVWSCPQAVATRLLNNFTGCE